MFTDPKIIEITPDTELRRLLEEAEENVLVLDKEGVRYRLVKETGAPLDSEKTPADYEAFLSAAGSWADVDVDAFLADVYESRRRSTRPPVEL
jgi:NADPH-dependent glutamate synthase beta subunit-like oxidoreductase